MKKRYLKPWVFGIVAGCMIVSAEAFLNFYPPSAYAFCLTCHARDLVNTIVNGLFHANFQTASLANRVVMVTSPAVLIGAFIAAYISGEHKKQRAEKPLLFFLYGFTVMTVGILIFGCPTRITIRAGYGDIYGIVALTGMFAGIAIGTSIVRRIGRLKVSGTGNVSHLKHKNLR